MVAVLSGSPAEAQILGEPRLDLTPHPLATSPRRAPRTTLQQRGRAHICGPVVGRKNHYGSKSKRGTEVIFYSLVEGAKLAGKDPAAYLRVAAEAMIREQRVLLPHALG